jgi:[acyl-carrier-protein] S-malonyltransferase
MKAYVFPGQGAQFTGMGKDLYERSSMAKEMFEKANDVLGFRITDLMFSGTDEDLKQTKVTQPAIFLHSTILAAVLGKSFTPSMTAGHSLGEFSKRAMAMQKACELRPSTMAAILGVDDKVVEDVCASVNEVVVPANYNSPGQIVISGSNEGIDRAIEILKEKGAKRAIKLAVGGAFHSPLMEPARLELETAIKATKFSEPVCPVYQNVNALPSSDPETIKVNLVSQLTSPVRWTQSVLNMVAGGATIFVEVGPGNVLQGLIKKIHKEAVTESAAF